MAQEDAALQLLFLEMGEISNWKLHVASLQDQTKNLGIKSHLRHQCLF